MPNSGLNTLDLTSHSRSSLPTLPIARRHRVEARLAKTTGRPSRVFFKNEGNGCLQPGSLGRHPTQSAISGGGSPAKRHGRVYGLSSVSLRGSTLCDQDATRKRESKLARDYCYGSDCGAARRSEPTGTATRSIRTLPCRT